jgi:hypothetical protein
MSKIRSIGPTLAAIVLAGCFDQTVTAGREPSRCELVATDICSMPMQTRMLEGVVNASDTSKPDEARVVPFVIPLLLPNGRPAAVVDCYVNTDLRTFSLVHTELSIPPRSKDAIDYLRDQHLCADQGSYAEDKYNRLETASAFPLSGGGQPQRVVFDERRNPRLTATHTCPVETRTKNCSSYVHQSKFPRPGDTSCDGYFAALIADCW